MTREPKESKAGKTLTRRSFIKALGIGVAAVGGGAALAGCAQQATPAPAPAGPTPTPVGIEKVVERIITPTPAPRGKITIKMSHVLAATEPQHTAWEMVAAKVKERTNGDVELQVFPAGQLGGDRDIAEQSRLGANIIGLAAFGYLSEYVRDFNAFGLPFLFTDWDTQGRRIFLSPLMDELGDRYLREGGMVLLATNYFFGERHIASARPINNPDDVKGLKIRIPPIDMWRELFVTALGAAGTPLEWAEVYGALQTGVIEAAEAPFSSIRGSKLHEVAKNVSTTGHFTQVNTCHVGFKFWDTLPEDVRKIIKEELIKGGEEYTKMQLASAGKDRDTLKAEGATIIEVDRKPFQDRVQVVYDKFAPTFSKGLLDKIYQLRGA